jgi:predicted peptidase
MKKRHALGLLGFVLGIASLGGCSGGETVMKDTDASAPAGTGFQLKTLDAGDHQRKYSVFIPESYSPDRKYPVIVFLHGVGEGGSDGTKMLGVGIAPEIAKRAATFPFIVIFPQSGSGYWHPDSQQAADAIAALHAVEHDYSTDPNCVILTGLSTGGYGTWAIGAKYRNEFSGLVPMCTYADYKDVPILKTIPVWGFHNSGDPFALAMNTHSMCDAINKAGGSAKYTEYAAFGHDVWIRAYAKDDLYNWMLATGITEAKRRETGGGTAGNTSGSTRVVGMADHAAPAY